MSKTKEEFMHLKDDLKRLESTIEEYIRDGGEELLQKTEDKLLHIAEKIKKETEPIVKSLEVKGKCVNEYIDKNKWQSLGIALGIGIITGLYMVRGKK